MKKQLDYSRRLEVDRHLSVLVFVFQPIQLTIKLNKAASLVFVERFVTFQLKETVFDAQHILKTKKI